MTRIKILKLNQWRIRMVNISGTGYYAPTIEAIKVTTIKNMAAFDSQFISCIVY